MRSWYVALLFVSLVGCRPTAKNDAKATTIEVAAQAANAETFHARAAAALFDKDSLQLCVDIVRHLEPPPGSVAGWRPDQDPFEGWFAENKNFTRLSRTCDAEFSDRPALASCRFKKPTKPGAPDEMTLRFMDYEALSTNDEAHSLCLKGNGEWSAVRRNSAEWTSAKLDHDRKSLERTLKRVAAD